MTDSLHSDDHGLSTGVRESSNELGRSTNISRSDSVTCPSCHVTVTLSKNAEGRRRLVCPYCGTTYSHQESQIRALPTPTSDPLRHLRLPIVVLLYLIMDFLILSHFCITSLLGEIQFFNTNSYMVEVVSDVYLIWFPSFFTKKISWRR